MEELAKKKSVSMAQIAVAWSMAKDGESSLGRLVGRHFAESTLPRVCAGVTAPIVGTTSLKNLEDIIGAF